VAEASGQVSVFSGTSTGYSWDRMPLTGGARTHVADVTGTLTGSVETDARVSTAVSVQNGAVVEIAASGVTPISSDTAASTSVFGAALDSKLGWQVLTYSASSQTLAFFSETSPGTFAKVSTLSADCGTPTMLDAVEEPGDNFVSVCAGKAVQLVAGQLVLIALPTSAMDVGPASDGDSVFFGIGIDGHSVVRMTRSGPTWIEDSTISSVYAPSTMMVVSESSVVFTTPSGFEAQTLVNGTWQSSAALGASTPVTSATGAPAQLLAGQYELTLYTPGATAWTTTDLGSMGVAPHPEANYETSGTGLSVGCQSGVGESGWALLSLLALALSRRRAR
jgi:hypothetical protein